MNWIKFNTKFRNKNSAHLLDLINIYLEHFASVEYVLLFQFISQTSIKHNKVEDEKKMFRQSYSSFPVLIAGGSFATQIVFFLSPFHNSRLKKVPDP